MERLHIGPVFMFSPHTSHSSIFSYDFFNFLPFQALILNFFEDSWQFSPFLSTSHRNPLHSFKISL